MIEHEILVVGPKGAGKTTAIRSLADAAQITHDDEYLERNLVDLDYGEIAISDDERLLLYVLPGHDEFLPLWSDLRDRAEGLVILVKNDTEDPKAELLELVEEFREIIERGAAVIGLTHTDVAPSPTLADYLALIGESCSNTRTPVLEVDVRDRQSLVTMLLVLAATIEAKEELGRYQEELDGDSPVPAS